MWRLTQWKACDGVGCCDTHGLFPGRGENEGRCRYWTGKRCALMLDLFGPELQVALSPAERRVFAKECLFWPIPGKVESLNDIYTDKERKLLHLEPAQGCCLRWESANE